MKLIKQSFEILDPTGYTIDDIYKSIELAGRTCYLSYDKITDDSAKKFVNMIIKRGHTSVLEHGTVYLKIPWQETYSGFEDNWIHKNYAINPYSIVSTTNNNYYITTNYRALIENNWLDDLQYLCEPTEFHEKRISVRFILPISISREFCRHRVFSFAEQSTRYCNFNSGKFNNEITFIIPYWTDLKEARYEYWEGDWVDHTDQDKIPNDILKHFEEDAIDNFLLRCYSAESNYKFLVGSGRKPQEAREILPLCTKTELVMTGTISQWQGFFKLRCNKAAHPQAQELACSLCEEFIRRGLIE